MDFLVLDDLEERRPMIGNYRHDGAGFVPGRHADASFIPRRLPDLDALRDLALPQKATVLDGEDHHELGRYTISFVWPDVTLVELVCRSA